MNDSWDDPCSAFVIRANTRSVSVPTPVACFNICWARLRLYKAQEMLGERVLYFDTATVVFIQDHTLTNLTLGRYVEFCSGGLNNYKYKTSTGKTVCKVRGFSLNSEVCRI